MDRPYRSIFASPDDQSIDGAALSQMLASRDVDKDRIVDDVDDALALNVSSARFASAKQQRLFELRDR